MKKKIVLLVLHLQHGGIEKQTTLFANELIKKYDVEIISVYSMNHPPAYNIDKKVHIKYLIDSSPNKKEFLSAIKKFKILSVIKEGLKSKKILKQKHDLMVNEIKKLDCDFVVSTRIEYAEMLSKYAPESITTITQEHLHNDSPRYISRLRKALRKLDYLVALGPGSKANYEKWFSSNKNLKIVEIPNILEENSCNTSNLDNYTLISVGRMHPVKGFNDLLKIVKIVKESIPEIKLNLIGGGKEFKNLKSEIKKLGLEANVNMPGMLSSQDINKYLLSSDIYVMTSHSECFPMVLLEAANYGLPLLSFDVPVGPKALIKDDFNGYLIKNRNIKEMAEKIVYLMGNRSLMKTLGSNAKKNVIQYLPDNVMKKWYDIFDKDF